MKFDLRLPVGLLFSLYGVLLAVYGLFSNKAIYKKSLDMNVNLWWGVVMLAFGVLMLLFALRGRKNSGR